MSNSMPAETLRDLKDFGVDATDFPGNATISFPVQSESVAIQADEHSLSDEALDDFKEEILKDISLEVVQAVEIEAEVEDLKLEESPQVDLERLATTVYSTEVPSTVNPTEASTTVDSESPIKTNGEATESKPTSIARSHSAASLNSKQSSNSDEKSEKSEKSEKGKSSTRSSFNSLNSASDSDNLSYKDPKGSLNEKKAKTKRSKSFLARQGDKLKAKFSIKKKKKSGKRGGQRKDFCKGPMMLASYFGLWVTDPHSFPCCFGWVPFLFRQAFKVPHFLSNLTHFS